MSRARSSLAWLLLAVPTSVVTAAEADDVLATDAAFAASSQDVGQQAAFLEYLADDGIVFRPGPVPGKEWIAAHEPATGRLEWVPVAAAIDCSAKLAVSTGRWQYSNPAGGEPVAGHYLTVWRRQAEGTWRIVLDHGIDHESEASPLVSLEAALDRWWPTDGARTCVAGHSSETLVEAEEKLNRAIARRGLDDALRRHVTEGAIAYRDEGPPGLLTADWPVDGASVGADGLAQSAGNILAGDSDMAVTYGSIQGARQTGVDGPSRVYVRVWRHDDDRWRVAIDLQTPLPFEQAP